VPALALGSFEVTPLELAGRMRRSRTAARTPVRGVGWWRAARAGRGRKHGRLGPSSTLFRRGLSRHELLEVVDRGTGRVRALGPRAPSRQDRRGTTRETHGSRATAPAGRGGLVGFDDGTDSPGRSAALPIWTDFMRAATVEDPGSSRCRLRSSSADPAAARPTRCPRGRRPGLCGAASRRGPRVHIRPARGTSWPPGCQPWAGGPRPGTGPPPSRLLALPAPASARKRSAQSMTADDLFSGPRRRSTGWCGVSGWAPHP
jgi:hypothetical protein